MERANFKRTALSTGLGEAIKTFREAQTITQEKLAKNCEFDPVDLTAIEKGEYRLTLSDLEKLAEVLKVRPYQLLALGETFAMRKERQGQRSRRQKS
jgi:transcriptional regulator with XRE-family HTH domain